MYKISQSRKYIAQRDDGHRMSHKVKETKNWLHFVKVLYIAINLNM